MTAFAPGAGPPEKMIPTRRMSLAAMAPPPTGYPLAREGAVDSSRSIRLGSERDGSLDHRDDHGGWKGIAARSAHDAPREARRAVRRPLPDHRLRALELRQLGAPTDLRAHAVHGDEPHPAPQPQLASRRHRSPVHRGGAGADADGGALVPRHRGLRVPERELDPRRAGR